MNRVILFRGKDAIYREWIYGDLLTRANYAQIWQDSDSGKFPASVIPETVSQFTGLYDKNGVRIWEGDIIKLTINRSLIFSVNWVDDCGMFCLKCLSHHPRLNLEAFDTDFTTVDGDECEIIGNVFDNSDLLKGE